MDGNRNTDANANADADAGELDALAEELPADAAVDRAAVDRLRTVAHVLDGLVRVPGTEIRVGVDPVLGAIPAVGNALSTGLSLYVVAEAARAGVTYTTLLRMLGTVAVDAVGGSLPVVGPVFDALWRANERNVALLIEDLSGRHGRDRDGRDRARAGGAGPAPGTDPGTTPGGNENGTVVIEVEES